MKKLKTFDEFLNEGYSVNLKRGSARLTPIDNEILQIALKGLPKNIISNIESVEGHGSWTQTFETPITINNKKILTEYGSVVIEYYEDEIETIKEWYDNEVKPRI